MKLAITNSILIALLACAAAQNPCENIRNGQFFCKSCSTPAWCIQQNGVWTDMEIGQCDTEHSLYCDEQARGCIYKNECTIRRGPKFECQNSGIFPDPYDCSQYHVCSATKIDELVLCPTGSAYSPATKSCSLSTSNEICLKAQYECNNIGYMAAWPLDANIFYVCAFTNLDGDLVRYPLLYRCQDGNEFRVDRCVSVSGDVSGGSPVATSTMNSVCDVESKVQANANDCHSYYACTNGQLVSKTCPYNTYFEMRTLSCQFGSC